MKEFGSEIIKELGKSIRRLKKGRFEIFSIGSFRGGKSIIEIYETNPLIKLSISELFIVGNNYYDKGLYDRAIKIYEEIIGADSKNVAALNNLGISYLDKNNYEKAKLFLDMAFNINPKDIDALMNLGAYYIETKEFDQALLCFEELLLIKSDDVYILKMLGTIYANLERYSDAEIQLERALEFSPNDVELLNNLGVIADKVGKIIDSLQYFSRLFFLDQNFEFARKNVEVLVEERNLCNIRVKIDDIALSVGQEFRVLFQLNGEEHIPKNAIIEYGFFGKKQLVKYYIPKFKEEIGGFLILFDDTDDHNFILSNSTQNIEYLLNCDKNKEFKKTGFKNEVQFNIKLVEVNSKEKIILKFPIIKISKEDFKSIKNLDLKNNKKLEDNKYIERLVMKNQNLAYFTFSFELDKKTEEFKGYDASFNFRRGEGAYW